MGKMLPVNQKKANKTPKNKKKQPLKVVYITNPIKFKASVSEFRGLVQELTGRDADTPDSASPTVDDGVGGGGREATKVAAEDNVHAVLEGEVTKIGNLISDGEVEREVSDPSATGSYDDDFVNYPEMIDNLQGVVESNLVDVLKSLDAM